MEGEIPTKIFSQHCVGMLVAAHLAAIASTGACRAAEPIDIGPIESHVAVVGVPVDVRGTLSARLETFRDRMDGEVVWTLRLEDLERNATAIAKAAGLEVGACQDDRALEVRIERGELVAADPALTIRLYGKVRAWLCKPIKTHLTPELDAVAETTFSVLKVDPSAFRLTAASTRISVPDIERLGPLRGRAQAFVDEFSAKAQIDIEKALSERIVYLDRALPSMEFVSAEAGFAGKAFVGSAKGRMPASALAALLAQKLEEAQRP